MNTTAIIAEYNPFHNGHKFHLRSARKTTGSDYVFAVMSPSFVQRGESAVYDKWTRTRATLRCGADMVIELPVIYSTRTDTNAPFSIIPSNAIFNTFALYAKIPPITQRIIGAL